MSAPNRKGTGLGDGLGIWLAIGAAVVIGGGAWVSAHLGSWLAGLASPPAHPIDLVAGLAKGRVPWPVQSTIVSCVLLGVLIALTVTVLVVRSRTAHKRTRVDKAAVHMGLLGGHADPHRRSPDDEDHLLRRPGDPGRTRRGDRHVE
jgi:hypothetical protein